MRIEMFNFVSIITFMVVATWSISLKSVTAASKQVNISLIGDTYVLPEFDSLIDASGESPQIVKSGVSQTDGSTWIDQLVSYMGYYMDVKVTPITNKFAVIFNSAVDSNAISESEATGKNLMTLRKQVEVAAKLNNDKDSVAIISTGTNDILYRHETLGSLYQHWLDYYSNSSAKEICSNVNTLVNSGNKKVLVLGIGPLGIYPIVREKLNPSKQNLVSTVSDKINIYTQRCLSKLREAYNAEYKNIPEEKPNIVFFDYSDFLMNISNNPKKYKLKNTSGSCIKIVTSKEDWNNRDMNLCTNPSDWIFWDSLRPTTKVHNVLSNYIGSIISKDMLNLNTQISNTQSGRSTNNNLQKNIVPIYATDELSKTRVSKANMKDSQSQGQKKNAEVLLPNRPEVWYQPTQAPYPVPVKYQVLQQPDYQYYPSVPNSTMEYPKYNPGPQIIFETRGPRERISVNTANPSGGIFYPQVKSGLPHVSSGPTSVSGNQIQASNNSKVYVPKNSKPPTNNTAPLPSSAYENIKFMKYPVKIHIETPNKTADSVVKKLSLDSIERIAETSQIAQKEPIKTENMFLE